MIHKIPKMSKKEYDDLISNQFVCRIIFNGEKYPYIAPFLYVFYNRYIYFLSTRYGRKIQYFRENPMVAVEIEDISADLSKYKFVVLFGRLEEVTETEEENRVREQFVKLISGKNLSENILSALGHSKDDDTLSSIEKSKDKNLLWKLVDVEDIFGLKES